MIDVLLLLILSLISAAAMGYLMAVMSRVLKDYRWRFQLIVPLSILVSPLLIIFPMAVTGRWDFVWLPSFVVFGIIVVKTFAEFLSFPSEKEPPDSG